MAAAATSLAEELQNKMATSEDDAEYEADDSVDLMAENEDSVAANYQLQNGIMADQEGDEEHLHAENAAMSDQDAEDEDMEVSAQNNVEEDDSEDGEDDEDEDEDGEGVGAVKIQPGLLEDDEEALSGTDDDGDESVVTVEDDDESKDSDTEVEVEWKSTAGEEEEEPANPNRCIFCHQDEDNDPSEEFEVYLSCAVCGDNAHQQCARSAGGKIPEDEPERWCCPECVANKLVPETLMPQVEEHLDSSARRISRDRLPGDLLPSQRGTIKPDSHSVFNQLIAPDDPMDGSRLLRKRKPSSTEVDGDEPVSGTPRRRNRDNGSSHSRTHVDGANGAETDMPPPDPNPSKTNGDSKNEAPASPRISRSLRPKVAHISHATVLERAPQVMKLMFRLNPADLEHIQARPPRPIRRRNRPVGAATTPAPAISGASFVPSSYPAQPFYSLHEREMDELKSKPYGGILSEAEADTSMTLPKPEHRRQFDEARQKAEEEWKARAEAAAEAAAISGIKKPRKVSGPASQIEYIEFGQFQIDIWYAAPYPEEYSRNQALFICEFCLKYMESPTVAWRHKTKCPWKHPPGDEIYRHENISMFEVDGRKQSLYCQNLCLLAKLFLGSKTLYYDVEPFLFYVLTEYDELGYHFVGYFSKEKRPTSLNNVSCILVLPIFQRKGYGNLLIDFSYLLTRVEKKTGSPEKPLSDMGLVSYRNYWRLALCHYLQHYKSGDPVPSIRQMSDEMGLTPDDVISALEQLQALVRDPVTGVYALQLKTELYRDVIAHHESKGYASIDPKKLVWTPYIMGRGNAFDHAPTTESMAHREDDEDDNTDFGSHNGSKRDFGTFVVNDGRTEDITDSMGKLTTKSREPFGPGTSVGSAESSVMAKANGTRNLAYYEAAASIPPTRFEVFPPLPGSRNRNTPRPSGSRPRPRPRPRSTNTTPSRPAARSGGSSRRSATSRSSRRSGGTGRGPGRWPKGTKKSDFGMADSGPGMPPKLTSRRSQLGNEVLLGEEEEEEEEDEIGEDAELEEENEDGIVYDNTPAPRKRSSRDSTRGQGKPILGGKGPLVGNGLGNSLVAQDDADEEMGDAPLVDGDLPQDDSDGEEN
ncbi:hypothetical protein HYALB_00003470 [Hymenoscyphus albidus]|uniref:Histone acetyltransferase n=1 Tax=Hymenoscyphus albidus TaxID=595503 RepID=A0A9N9Q6E2_9HELO|nr:hypothetical protein HYALB_00003470 [Hymenoscyphus albidus]